MRPRPAGRGLTRNQAASIGVVAIFIGGAIFGINVYTSWRLEGHIIPSTPYADVFTRLDDPLDILFALGDGQASVALARDPTLSNVSLFRGIKGEAALRAGRPLQGYLGWIFSAGHPQWAEEGVVIATLLGCGVAAIGCADMLKRRGQSPWLGLFVLELPGALAAIRQLGPELIGLGLVALALGARDDKRIWLAVGLFTVAGFARETYLLIPLLFAWRERRFLIPHVAWLAWTGVVYLRYGAYGPFIKRDSARFIVAPFTGLARAIPHLQFPLVTGLLLALIPALTFVVLVKRRRDPLMPIVVIYAVLAIFLNAVVVVWWASFSRVVLPMTAFALIALVAPMGKSADVPALAT